MAIAKALYSSERDTWETPPEVFEWAERRWGKFEYDLAANRDNTKCPDGVWFGPGSPVEINSLTATWPRDPLKWLNPPYGRGVGAWVSKAAETGNVVMLLPARTDVKWFHDYIWIDDGLSGTTRHGADVIFWRGRIRFVGAPAPAPFPSMLVRF